MRVFFPCLISACLLSACNQESGPAEPQSPQPQSTQPATVSDAAAAASSAGESPEVTAYDPAHDYFSFANTREFTTRHLDLALQVDFEASQLRGQATLHMRRIQPAASQVILDSRALVVESVQLLQDANEPGGEPIDLGYTFGESDPIRGEPLIIDLPAASPFPEEFQLRIGYHTGRGASALMWLGPELTAGKKYPFMFTQSQSIHARSWIPLQDTPGMRITYSATVSTPPELLAVMSADNDPLAERDGLYYFEMPQAIPSYLLALAVGNVFFESFGEDTGVYAEPEILQAAAFEFADTQAMLDVAENLYGPYQWGRYDLLILPPSFPFGGMENPRLSFITPSVIAGDRSLTSVIAHELAHSWSGNLVSNATWRDIWLNEGTTSYLEGRLMEVLYGKERTDEERLLSYQSLLEDLNTVPANMQALAPRFDSGDPDEGQGGLQYSKGQLMLENLEAAFGREIFDAYMAGYFSHFAMQSITSEQFLDYIDANLLQKYPGIYSREQVEQWLYEPGLPTNAVPPVSQALDRVAADAVSWSKGEVPTDEIPFAEWSPQAKVYFIKALPRDLTTEQLLELDQAFGFSQTGNAEIAVAWFTQVALRRFEPAYEPMSSHLGKYGRTRLVKPVYEGLVKNGEDAELARTIFAEKSTGYHPLTVAAIQPLLQAETNPPRAE